MVAIVNELSLEGQFNSTSEFISSLSTSVKLLNVLRYLNIELYKNQSFYDSKVTSGLTLNQVIIGRDTGFTDEIRGLKSQLAALTFNPPFWDGDRQKHNCTDSYICEFTEEKCQYGIAEAFEHDKITFSFLNERFKVNSILIKKNRLDGSITNFFIELGLLEWLTDRMKSLAFNIGGNEEYFPNKKIANNLLPLDKLSEYSERKSHQEKISIYENWGYKVALIHDWRIDRHISELNGHVHIYMKIIKGKKNYLSLDTMHGTFEVFDDFGKHKGEYNFLGNQTEEPKGHEIKIK